MHSYMDDILAARGRLAIQPAAGSQLVNGINIMRTLESVSVTPREMELRFQFSQSASDLKRFSIEAADEASRLIRQVRSSPLNWFDHG